MKSVCLCIMIFFSCCCFSIAGEPGQKQNNVLDKRITVYGGARLFNADGTFSSTREGRPATEIGMDDLGLDENEVSAIGGVSFNFAKRWNVSFDYFGYHDDAVTTAGKKFYFDDIEIPVNASVRSNLDIDLYVLKLGYNLIHTDRARFGIGVGIHGIDFDLRISGKLSVNDVEVPLGEGSEDFLAPIPNIWVYGAYAFTERVIFRYGAGWMSAGYDDYDGTLYLANAAVEYWPFQNAGFGAGYNYLTADIDYETGSKIENYDVDLSGVLFYVTMGF